MCYSTWGIGRNQLSYDVEIIFHGDWGKKYSEIAEDCDCTTDIPSKMPEQLLIDERRKKIYIFVENNNMSFELMQEKSKEFALHLEIALMNHFMLFQRQQFKFV